jgi:hypothetical protein
MNKFITQGKAKQVNATILAPENAGLRMILNVCALDGKFESKLDGVLTKKWSKVREDYKGWHATQHDFKPGSLNTTAVASDIWVINMLAKDKDGKLDQTALQTGVKKLGAMAKYERGSVHVSTFLTAEVPALQDLLVKHLIEEGVNVYFYNEPSK